jgi:hypothetical protein
MRAQPRHREDEALPAVMAAREEREKSEVRMFVQNPRVETRPICVAGVKLISRLHTLSPWRPQIPQSFSSRTLVCCFEYPFRSITGVFEICRIRMRTLRYEETRMRARERGSELLFSFLPMKYATTTRFGKLLSAVDDAS